MPKARVGASSALFAVDLNTKVVGSLPAHPASFYPLIVLSGSNRAVLFITHAKVIWVKIHAIANFAIGSGLNLADRTRCGALEY
jgi:hypothetical protein